MAKHFSSQKSFQNHLYNAWPNTKYLGMTFKAPCNLHLPTFPPSLPASSRWNLGSSSMKPFPVLWAYRPFSWSLFWPPLHVGAILNTFFGALIESGATFHQYCMMVLLLYTILVWTGCCNKNTITWGAYNSKHLFLPVWETEKSKIMALIESVYWGPASS